MCLSCINEHKNHRVISYEDKIIDIKSLRRKMNELNEVINKFKMNLEEIIKKFQKLKDNMDIYYNINNIIISRYEMNKNRNYNLLMNLNNINDIIDEEINKLRKDYSYGYNLDKLLYLYSEINEENIEIELNYKPKSDNEEKVRLFGDDFIKNNLHKCKIIYDNEENDIKEYFEDIDWEYNHKNPITIKLKGINNITDMSDMFYDCNSLSSLPDISNWNTSNVHNMSYIFSDCKSLSSLPDISKWNTSNVTDMNGMFYNCKSLSSLPDTSKWNTSNVTGMS